VDGFKYWLLTRLDGSAKTPLNPSTAKQLV